MKYFDSFAGIGGFSLGIQQAYEDNIIQSELRQQEIKKSEDNTNLSFERHSRNSERD